MENIIFVNNVTIRYKLNSFCSVGGVIAKSSSCLKNPLAKYVKRNQMCRFDPKRANVRQSIFKPGTKCQYCKNNMEFNKTKSCYSIYRIYGSISMAKKNGKYQCR